MSTTYPTSIQTMAVVVDNTTTVIASHHNNNANTIEALEAKVGVDGSSNVTSIDYKLIHLPGQAQAFDIGSFDLRGLTLTSDVSTGTIPVNVSSTTKCTKLNADTVDGKHVSGADGAGEITTNDGTQTLTNKTISGGTITGITDLATADGGTGSSSTTYCDLTVNVAGTLPVGNGGTGSATKNFVDLTNTQTISGAKTFSDIPILSLGANANNQQITGLCVENRTDDTGCTQSGRIWFRTNV